MKNPFHVIKKINSFVRKQLAFDTREKILFEHFSQIPKSVVSKKNIALVQCVEDPFYFALFGQIICSLRKDQDLWVDQYIFRSLNVNEMVSINRFLFLRLIVNSLAIKKWRLLFSSFCNAVANRSTSIKPISDTSDFFWALKVWRNLPDRTSLSQLHIDEILVGDLINDSYLRFRPAHTINLADFYLAILIWQAKREIRRLESYFARNKPKIFLTSYCTYIQHGIPVRVALKHKVNTYSFSNYQEFAKTLTLTDYVHTKNPESYAMDFLAMEDKVGKLALAEKALKARISGELDNAIAYMRNSPYVNNGIEPPNLSGKAIIFLHDFYDSPHVYHDMVFPDFWVWVCTAIENLKLNGIDFYVKAHPNQVALSSQVMDMLLNKFPDIKLIDSRISNRQIAEAGLSCAITVHGTIAHEMAYLGVPSIASARHPHVSFQFTRTAKTKEEFVDLLKNFSYCGISKNQMREQSLIFYYMHNLNFSENDKLVQDHLLMMRNAYASIDVDSEALLKLMEKLTFQESYNRYIAQLSGILEK